MVRFHRHFRTSVSIRNTQFLKNILNLTNCNFLGPIPASLGNLTKVTQIFLNSNYFTGHIPSSLSHLKDLNLIDFSNNKFQGRTLDFFTSLTKLAKVYLFYNQLILISQDQYQYHLGTSQKLLILCSNITTLPAKFHHHFQI